MADLTVQRRSWLSTTRRRAHGAGALLGATLLLAGCTATGGGDPEESAAAAPEATEKATSAPPELAAACQEFWGDPDYTAPLSRVVLDRAATAPEAGPSDPFFYAMTGDDIEAAFEGAPESALAAASDLADWFRSEPELGTDADLEAFATAWDGVAESCAGSSVAASWVLGPGEDGTKPAALTCADVFDTPGTLSHFANANVLTSNMFKLVGLSPRTVPTDRMEDVQKTADLLSAEIAAVDDDAVREALTHVRAPFQDALDGDTTSDGLRDPLTELGTACDAAGYSSPELGELDEGESSEDDGGLV
ncbi:hypothetical protein [Brachybacterium sacelli]|uniref:Imelysin-like domain-containing protein n=1 Tax=Brachybacterium sacelli TaxID=173364 RepID=A0ABS4X0Y6_9MICO|nr:hypothetical protein [Brachybacterium sacelli]MBP2382115.1 hypothetical protein [Brachybacterium sacelli]